MTAYTVSIGGAIATFGSNAVVLSVGDHNYFGIFATIGARADALRSYIPDIPGSSRVFQSLFAAEGRELDIAIATAAELLDQSFVERATWGIAEWELVLDIIPPPDATIESRRSAVAAKLHLFTATNQNVAHIVETFGSQATVVENPGDYSVVVRVLAVAAIAYTEAAIEDALRRTIPAHLGVTVEYVYGTWDDLDAHGWLWNDVDALGDNWYEFELDIREP